MSASIRCLAIFLFLGVLFLVGCSGGSNMAKLTGTVSFQGKPLKEGMVQFHPDRGRPGFGKVVDGKIIEGEAPIGKNKVSVQAKVESKVEPKPGEMKKQESLIPEHYGDPAKSGLVQEIVAGENNVTIDLK